MAYRQIIVQVAATALICAASAIAQAAPANRDEPMPNKEQMATWHQQMCADRYAHHVGGLAYLEAKLALTDAQRPLFENWKGVILADAKAREDNCVAMGRDLSHPPSILDREARWHDMLQKQLAVLDAQRPAMTALYQALTPDQQRILDDIGFEHGDRRPGPHMHGGPHGGPGGMHDEDMGPDPDHG